MNDDDSMTEEFEPDPYLEDSEELRKMQAHWMQLAWLSSPASIQHLMNGSPFCEPKTAEELSAIERAAEQVSELSFGPWSLPSDVQVLDLDYDDNWRSVGGSSYTTSVPELFRRLALAVFPDEAGIVHRRVRVLLPRNTTSAWVERESGEQLHLTSSRGEHVSKLRQAFRGLPELLRDRGQGNRNGEH